MLPSRVVVRSNVVVLAGSTDVSVRVLSKVDIKVEVTSRVDSGRTLKLRLTVVAVAVSLSVEVCPGAELVAVSRRVDT